MKNIRENTTRNIIGCSIEVSTLAYSCFSKCKFWLMPDTKPYSILKQVISCPLFHAGTICECGLCDSGWIHSIPALILFDT